MRHLAVRFVRQMNFARIASAEHPLSGLNNQIHVVDPQLDLCEYLRGEKVLELGRSILARKLLLDLLKIRNDYDDWCIAFKNFLDAERRSSLEKRHIRGKLLDHSAGLLSALELPNVLDRHGPTTSSKSEEPGLAAVCDSTRALVESFVDHLNRENDGRLRDSVRLRRFMLKTLKQLIFAALQPKPQIVSFPHLVRAAVVEACNLRLDSFPLVTEHCSYLSLAGVDLPSLISPLIMCQFSHKSDLWPLVLLASGNVYPMVSSPRANGSSVPFDQNAQLSLLVMDEDMAKCSQTVHQLVTLLHAFLSGIGLTFATAAVGPPNLFLYERSALSFCHGSSAVELARFSNIGDYVARRSQIVKMKENGNVYLNMAFVKLNLDAVVNCYSHLTD